MTLSHHDALHNLLIHSPLSATLPLPPYVPGSTSPRINALFLLMCVLQAFFDSHHDNRAKRTKLEKRFLSGLPVHGFFDSLSLCLSLSVSFCLSLSVCLCLSVSLGLSLCLSLPLSSPFFLCLSFFSATFSVSLSPSFCFSPPFFVFLYLSRSLAVSVSISLYSRVSALSPSLAFFFFLSLSLAFHLCPFLSAVLCLPFSFLLSSYNTYGC